MTLIRVFERRQTARQSKSDREHLGPESAKRVNLANSPSEPSHEEPHGGWLRLRESTKVLGVMGEDLLREGKRLLMFFGIGDARTPSGGLPPRPPRSEDMELGARARWMQHARRWMLG